MLQLLCAAQIDTAPTRDSAAPLVLSNNIPNARAFVWRGKDYPAARDTHKPCPLLHRSSNNIPQTPLMATFSRPRKAAACLPALVQLLERVASAVTATGTFSGVLSLWFRETAVDAADPFSSSVLLELLPIGRACPALPQQGQLLLTQGIYEVTQQLLSHSCKATACSCCHESIVTKP